MGSETRFSKKKRGFKRSKFILPALAILGLAGCLQSPRPVLPPGELTAAGSSVVEVRVATSSDDAEESATGSVSLTSTDLELIRDASDQKVGMRFAGLTLPAGATITNAYIQFKTDETTSEATSLTIQGEASDNALTFSSSNKVSTRAKTAASVAWTPAAWSVLSEVGPNQRTPNLTSVVQEIVNRPGWASGHALALIVTGSGKRVAKSYNGDAAGAPLLHVEYSASDVPPPPPPPPGPGPVTLENRVATSSDDAEESATGSVSLTSTDLELIRDASDQKVGMRFAGLTLPAGATITNAYVQFKVDKTSSEATSLTVQGEASDNALTFSSSNKVSTRARTSATVAWTPVPWTTVGTVGPDQRTPNLAAIVQEIVNRPGWASGHALAIIITGSGKRVAKSYNGDAAGAPLLHVEYSTSTGGGGNAPPKVDSFSAAPTSVTTGQAVTFTWSVSDPEGGALSCTLDADGNGTPDYTIANCKTTTSQTHSYAAAGSYQAKLTVTDSSNASATAQAAVSVSGGGGGAVTLESRILASSDDAEESATGAMYKTQAALEFVFENVQAANQTVGLRFDGLNLPRGVAITNAYIQFVAKATSSGATSLTFQGEASDNASTFNTAKNNVTGRVTTGAAVAWSPASWTSGAVGPDQRTPNLAAIVQEIVNRPGWVSGDALAFIVSGSGQRIAWAYDGDTAKAALLHVEYSTTSAPPNVDRFTVNPGSSQLGQAVTFSWSVSDPEGGVLSCTLDVDGNGTPEYTFSNCKTTTSQAHSFAAAGSYTPVLTVKNAANVTDTAAVNVQITNGNAVTLAAAGDIACDPTSNLFNGGAGTPNNCHMKATSDLILNLNPTAVLTLGDHQYNYGTLAQFRQSYDLSWGRFKNITYPAPGSHEYDSGSATGYFDYFGSAAGDPTKGYYSFELGTWHVIVLNSNCLHTGGCGAGSPEEQWLRADLAASAKACTLAVIHYPRFSSGYAGNKTTITPLWQALYEAGAELVLSGNDHHYERFAPQDPSGNPDPVGVREFLVGTGGKQLYNYGTAQPNSEIKNNTAYGVLKLTLKPGSYDWAFVPEPGKTFTDSGSQSCH